VQQHKGLNMNKTIKKLVVIAAVALSAGALAQTYNVYNHKKMAAIECGGEQNIKSITSKKFECIEQARKTL